MTTRIVKALCLAALLAGCATTTKQPEGVSEDIAIRAPALPPPAPSYFVHQVKFAGQTLGRISEWYTGSYDNWREIARANDLAVPNTRLKVGREVKIPTELVTRHEPLPEPKRRRTTAKPSGEEKGKGGESEAAVDTKEGPPAHAQPREAPQEAAPLPLVIGPR